MGRTGTEGSGTAILTLSYERMDMDMDMDMDDMLCMTSSINPSIKAAAWLAWLVYEQEGTKRHGTSCYASTRAVPAVDQRVVGSAPPHVVDRHGSVLPRQGGLES